MALSQRGIKFIVWDETAIFSITPVNDGGEMLTSIKVDGAGVSICNISSYDRPVKLSNLFFLTWPQKVI